MDTKNQGAQCTMRNFSDGTSPKASSGISSKVCSVCQSPVKMIIVVIIVMTIIIVTTMGQMLEHLRGALVGVLGV